MSEASALPDIASNPDAVLGDTGATWRNGQPPSYRRTREYYEQSEWPRECNQRASHELNVLSQEEDLDRWFARGHCFEPGQELGD